MLNSDTLGFEKLRLEKVGFSFQATPKFCLEMP